MDLWIRSQDRMELINCSQVESIYVEDNYIKYFTRDDNYNIGKYKSEERALEVLDEIQTILRGKYATSFDYKTSLKGFKPEDIEHMLELMAVYEMPKE